jgi:hypothetical protein
VYDVLKARTSEKKGDAPTIDATAGTVIRWACAVPGAPAASPSRRTPGANRLMPCAV